MPLGARTTALPAPLLALTMLLPVMPLPISTVTLPAPVLAVTQRLAALSGRTTSMLPPPVSAETRVTTMPARFSLTLPPSLWAVMSDETVGLRWTCHSVAPLQAVQGKWNQGCPALPPLSVRVAWPSLEIRLRVGWPCFSRY